jgi:hypothetical protein
MNHIFITNFIVDSDLLSKNIASYLIESSKTKNYRFDWDQFLSFSNTDSVAQRLVNTGQIMVLPTQSKQDLSQNLLPFFVKYDEPTYLILGSLSDVSIAMQEGLLRFVEEPPQNLNLILTARSKSEILTTLISRCEIKILPTKVAVSYLNKEKNEELLKDLPKPRDFIQSLLQNKRPTNPEFKNVSRDAWETWLWQLEYLCTEIIFKNPNDSRLNSIFENIIKAKSLNQANVLNRFVWAQLFS